MVRFHHVNLGVPPGGIDDQASFLVEVLGYRHMELDDRLRGVGAHWFEAADGSQVHLSEDPAHRAAARAHVAVVVGDQLDEMVARLRSQGADVQVADGLGTIRVALCRDPSGNLWELRDS